MKRFYNRRILGIANIIFLFISVLPLFLYDYDYAPWFYIILFVVSTIEIVIAYYAKLYENRIYFIIDMIGTLSLLSSFSVFILLRFVRLISVFRRFNGSKLLFHIIKYNFKTLVFVFQIMIVYSVFSSVIVFNIEPETFDYNYFNAFYWSIITLTTIGYGDFIPVTVLGKSVTVISTILGVGIIALPTAVFASGFIECYNDFKNINQEEVEQDKEVKNDN